MLCEQMRVVWVCFCKHLSTSRVQDLRSFPRATEARKVKSWEEDTSWLTILAHIRHFLCIIEGPKSNGIIVHYNTAHYDCYIPCTAITQLLYLVGSYYMLGACVGVKASISIPVGSYTN